MNHDVDQEQNKYQNHKKEEPVVKPAPKPVEVVKPKPAPVPVVEEPPKRTGGDTYENTFGAPKPKIQPAPEGKISMQDFLKIPKGKISPSTQDFMTQMQQMIDSEKFMELADVIFDAECDDDANREIDLERLEQYAADRCEQ